MQEMNSTSKNKVSLSLDMRLIIAVLLIVIAGMLAMWKPWAGASSSDRTITVSGEAKITETPDEYTFMPYYEFREANKDTALANLSTKSDELVKKLKDLGVASSKIKINSDGYDWHNYYYDDSAKQYTYTLRPTVVVNSLALSQKVQDYLVTTTPTGQVSPITGFSTTLRKTLESKARDEATKDARSKADQSAKNLGFKVVKVKTITDGGNFGTIMPYATADMAVSSGEAKVTSLAVQPGQNDLTYSVSVVYYIR